MVRSYTFTVQENVEVDFTLESEREVVKLIDNEAEDASTGIVF